MKHLPVETMPRIRRLFALSTMSFAIMLVCWVVTAWLLMHEVSITYATNYATLTDAGLSHLVTSPEVISERLMLLILFVPMIGAGIVFPIMYKAVYELHMIVETAVEVASDQAINEDV